MIERFKANLEKVHDRIREAELRSGRPAGSVRLIGVTKYVDSAVTRHLVAAGCHELGENRPQVLWEKADQLSGESIDWHLIGHLQRNKVKRTIEITKLIHSVDSIRLIDAIEEAASGLNRQVQILLEVNVSNDQAKHGFRPEELPAALDRLSETQFVRTEGLMCMAGLESDADQTRREFAELRCIAENLAQNLPPNVQMDQLSMGMSGDFEVAIEEGATLVRIGSLLFE